MEIINKWTEAKEGCTCCWFACYEDSKGRIYKDKWEDDPEEWKEDPERTWRSGEDKACAAVNGTLENGGCNC